MDRPRVARFEFDGTSTQLFGKRVLPVFLQAERLHAEQVAVPGVARSPGRPGPGDPVVQHHRPSERDITQMRQLQREQVARMVEQVPIEVAVPLVQLAVGPRQQRRMKGTLPFGRLVPAGRSSREARLRHRQHLGVVDAEQQRCLHQVSRDVVGVGVERRLQRRQRIETKAVEHLEHLVVDGNGLRTVGRMAFAASVKVDHGRLLGD